MYGGWEAQNEPKISFKNGILRIIQEASSDMYERLLVINLPAASVGENTNINVEHIEKDIVIKNIKINKLNVINKNGLIQIENIEAKNIFAKNNAGGIKILESNVEEIKRAGADVIVAGNAVFKAENRAEMIKKLKA
jgi:3-keto-L-gulonate-6-phosphate decarboxylase